MMKEDKLGQKQLEAKLARYKKLIKEREEKLKEKRQEFSGLKKEINELEHGHVGRAKWILVLLSIIFAAYVYFTYFKK